LGVLSLFVRGFLVIKKLPNGKFQLVSKKGKNLGTFKTRAEAEKRERQVNFFKSRRKRKKK
jgi:hypothetical protein